MEIRRYREAAGLTKTELAQKMGVSHPTICRWENGKLHPAGTRLPALALILDCTIDQLYGLAPSDRESV